MLSRTDFPQHSNCRCQDHRRSAAMGDPGPSNFDSKVGVNVWEAVLYLYGTSVSMCERLFCTLHKYELLVYHSMFNVIDVILSILGIMVINCK